MSSALRWYARRLRHMSGPEVAGRASDHLRRLAWSHRALAGSLVTPAPSMRQREDWVMARAGDVSTLGDGARRRVIEAAEALLAGRCEILGSLRKDMADPDWFHDGRSEQRFPDDIAAAQLDYRSGRYGNVKQVWELSRHHHLTVLAMAWALTHDDRYAVAVDRQLRSWWSTNRFMYGVNWVSGIELGIRLISWVWVRRLLEGWVGAAALFEENDDALGQIYWHQRFLAAFPSRGSSANNHLVAEMAGLLVGSCAFGWFTESERWAHMAFKRLDAALADNTFDSGVNRELAFAYHGLVCELGLVAMVEASAAGMEVGGDVWSRLCSMVDVGASLIDGRLRGPRQGDGDDGRALVLDDAAAPQWGSLLAVGARLFGPLPWWPAFDPDDPAGAALADMVAPPPSVANRPPSRLRSIPDAGIALLRAEGPRGEIWCRCDGGPHGFGSLAAHAHADALSVEVRYDGVDILADPGTYCYHEEPEWRRYFRSTRAHNTVELDDRDQSEAGGPFMWQRQARATTLELADLGVKQRWSAEHDGYHDLDGGATHCRTVTLDARRSTIEIVDLVRGTHDHRVSLLFHLGPAVVATLQGRSVALAWTSPGGADASAVMTLPVGLDWELHRGETEPIIGWYSPGFGVKEPAHTLVGNGTLAGAEFTTTLEFDPSS